MNIEYANAMTAHMARLFAEITEALIVAENKADPEDFVQIRRSLGRLITNIDLEILGPIYRNYPELDPFPTLSMIANPGAQGPIRVLPASGKWNFVLLDAAWTMQIDGKTFDDVTFGDSEIDDALAHLDGQTLTHAEWTADCHLIPRFKEGACINASMSPRHDADSGMWWLLQNDGNEAAFDGKGILTIAQPK